jgi:hypothetical protein
MSVSPARRCLGGANRLSQVGVTLLQCLPARRDAVQLGREADGHPLPIQLAQGLGILVGGAPRGARRKCLLDQLAERARGRLDGGNDRSLPGADRRAVEDADLPRQIGPVDLGHEHIPGSECGHQAVAEFGQLRERLAEGPAQLELASAEALRFLGCLGEIACRQLGGCRRPPRPGARGSPAEGDDLLFGRTAAAPFTPTHVRKRALTAWAATAVGGFLRGEGVDLVPIGLHELRHSFSSWLIAAGVPETRCDWWMGHANHSVASRYRHQLEGQLAEDAARLDAYLSGATSGKVVQLPTGTHTGTQREEIAL